MAGAFQSNAFQNNAFQTDGGAITVPLLDAGPVLYAPTVVGTGGVQALTAPLLDGAADLYAPTIAQTSGTQALTVPLLDGAATVYAPTVVAAPVTVVVPLLDGAAAVYTPAVTFAAGTVTSSFSVNAILKRTMDGPGLLVYPGVIGSGLGNNSNIHAGPIPITPGTQITVQLYAQNSGNLGIFGGTTTDLSAATQNTFQSATVGTHTFTVTGSNKYVWVYSFSYNAGRTGSGWYRTDKTLGLWWWLDAVKTTTQTGSRTINAVIAPLRFTANAVKTTTQTGSRTINAIIRQRNIPGSFTVNAQLERTFKVNAVLNATRTGAFTANAYVISVPITGSFTANAIRLKTIIGGGGGQALIFNDAFSTSTSAPPFNAGTPALGNTWVWSDWDSTYASAAASLTHVDAGGFLTVPANDYDSMHGPPSITAGELYFDFWVPATGDLQQDIKWYDLEWWVEVYDNETDYRVRGASGAGALWPVTRSAWHRVHVVVDGATARAHLWKVGDAEPATYTTIQTTWPVSSTNNPTYLAQMPILDLYYAPEFEALRLDNVMVLGPSVGLTASAVKTRTQAGSFSANAVIKKLGQTGSFTANAEIGQGSFWANAILIGTRTGSRTIDAVIKGSSSGSFTANAYFGFRTTSSFTADANLRLIQAGSFPINYMTRQTPTSPPIPSLGVPTKIYINGVDVSGHIKWATASFTAKVNGQMGDCSLEVIDKAHDLTFTFGDEIQLYIDGIIRWGGWVQQVNRTFPFPVMKSPATEARVWKITGVDYNFFLDRRILHDSGEPNRTWNYPAGTADNAIFNDIWPYFDTTGFTKNIHHVGDGVLDIKGVTSKTGGNVAQGGFSMRDVLLHLSWDTGAIFYVTPEKVVTYVDADQVSSPYTLTDQPSGTMDVGFHDVRITEDSTEMVNDAHVWGAGKGSANVVHSRAQSSPSQDDHGRWQAGNFTAGIYKQATADAVALSRVEGSPESKRGAKNPKRAVELLTWEPVFGVGDVVNFHDSQFFLPPADPADAPTHDDVLPIRTMTITWPTPYHPVFALQLSWEIDAVWSFFDPWLPVGDAGLGGGGGGGGGGTRDGPPEPGGCSDEVCGITDSFNRVDGLPGVSDSGAAWEISATSNGIVEISGNRLHMRSGDFNGTYYEAVNALFRASPQSGRLVYTPVAGLNGLPMARVAMTHSSLQFNNGPGAVDEVYVGRGSASDTTSFALVAGTSYNIEWDESSGTQSDWRVWVVNTSRPSSPTISVSGGSPGTASTVGIIIHVNTVNRHECYIENFDLDDVNRCTAVQFDNFKRTGSGWQTATPSGYPWTTPGTPGGTLSTNGTQGVWTCTSSAFAQTARMLIDAAAGTSAPWVTPAGGIVTMRTSFQITAVGGSTSDYGAIAWSIGSEQTGDNVYGGLEIRTGGNFGVEASTGAGTIDNYILTSAWTANVDYNVVFQFENGVAVRLKYWLASTSEPSAWSVELDASAVVLNGGTDDIWFEVDCYGRTAKSIKTNYIEFDYDGKACYPTGSMTMIDSFDDRSIALTGAPGTTTGSILGPISLGDGSVWANGGQWNPGTPDIWYGVESGVARIRHTNDGITSGDRVSSLTVLSDSSSSYIPWSVTGNGAPDLLFTEPTLTLSIDFMCDNWQLATGQIHVGTYIEFFLGVGWESYDGVTNGVEVNYVYIDGGASSSVYVPQSHVNGAWYTYKLFMSGSLAVAKVWERGTAEPGWAGSANIAPRPWHNVPPYSGEFTMMLHSVGSVGSYTNFYFDNFQVESPTLPSEGSGGFTVPAGTHLTEDLTQLSVASGSPSMYPANSQWRTTNAILPGSAVLSIAGAIQYGNWSVIDADAGVIQYDPSFLASSTVSLTYITNGPLS